eukprot:3381226-Alexandrium_andersonii.AAC.1
MASPRLWRKCHMCRSNIPSTDARSSSLANTRRSFETIGLPIVSSLSVRSSVANARRTSDGSSNGTWTSQNTFQGNSANLREKRRWKSAAIDAMFNNNKA